MIFKHVAVVTSSKSWFIPHAECLVSKLKSSGYQAKIYTQYEKVPTKYEVVFALSYFRIISKDLLNKHRHTLVVHESALPEGRGWAPLFWQILKGKSRIPVSLFEADESADHGLLYLRDSISLKGTELYDEIRAKQAQCTMKMCIDFLRKYKKLKPVKQFGRATYYRRRTPADSELNVNQNILKQFNLLRIVNNSDFPAFFRYKNKKYFLNIRAEETNA